jgi:uncharacterized damage-inducible protein DinB
MKETKRIIHLFEKGYNGSPWIDVNLVDTLRSVTPEQALKKIKPTSNSIWEITNHIISWRKTVLKRVQGEVIKTPSHNYFIKVKSGSKADWKKTLDELAATQKDWIKFLKSFKKSKLEEVYEPNGMNYYEHIQGILQHDVYHLGQIVMLTKLV